MPERLRSKNSEQLLVLNRLTDIIAAGKFDHGVMMRYQNLTRKPELIRPRCTPLSQALGRPLYHSVAKC